MTKNIPDRWTIVKIATSKETFYKVLGSWSGGYLDGDSWRLNSGITEVQDHEDHYVFIGNSGSEYHCYKESYGMNMPAHGALAQMQEQAANDSYTVETLEDQDFTALEVVGPGTDHG